MNLPRQTEAPHIMSTKPVWAKRFGSASNDGATYPVQVAVGPGVFGV